MAAPGGKAPAPLAEDGVGVVGAAEAGPEPTAGDIDLDEVDPVGEGVGLVLGWLLELFTWLVESSSVESDLEVGTCQERKEEM